MDLGIEGRVALVMGASQGIGLGVAQVLAREGVPIALASRSAERLEAAAAKIEGKTAVLPADSSDLDQIATLPSKVADALGAAPTILVVNTGGPPPGSALEHGSEDWEEAYRTLVLAPRALIDGCLPGMRAEGWGRIVNVSSTSVREPIPSLALSNIHRPAAEGLFNTLAREIAAEGITLNTIATGRFATDRQRDHSGSIEAAEARAREEVPAGRLGQPEEYGDLVAFLCSDRAAYITGSVVTIDGGMTKSV